MLISFPENPEKLTAFEKMHIPAVWLLGSQIKVTVGEKPHLMMPNHFIEWIELYKSGELIKHVDLKPNDKPEAIFEVSFESLNELLAREHCNFHGIWQSNKEEAIE